MGRRSSGKDKQDASVASFQVVAAQQGAGAEPAAAGALTCRSPGVLPSRSAAAEPPRPTESVVLRCGPESCTSRTSRAVSAGRLGSGGSPSPRAARPSTTAGPFRSLKGGGFKANYFDAETGAEFWISGCRKDGTDRLYGERVPVEIDDEVREEYWTVIRGQPERAGEKVA